LFTEDSEDLDEDRGEGEGGGESGGKVEQVRKRVKAARGWTTPSSSSSVPMSLPSSSSTAGAGTGAGVGAGATGLFGGKIDTGGTGAGLANIVGVTAGPLTVEGIQAYVSAPFSLSKYSSKAELDMLGSVIRGATEIQGITTPQLKQVVTFLFEALINSEEVANSILMKFIPELVLFTKVIFASYMRRHDSSEEQAAEIHDSTMKMFDFWTEICTHHNRNDTIFLSKATKDILDLIMDELVNPLPFEEVISSTLSNAVIMEQREEMLWTSKEIVGTFIRTIPASKSIDTMLSLVSTHVVKSAWYHREAALCFLAGSISCFDTNDIWPIFDSLQAMVVDCLGSVHHVRVREAATVVIHSLYAQETHHPHIPAKGTELVLAALVKTLEDEAAPLDLILQSMNAVNSLVRSYKVNTGAATLSNGMSSFVERLCGILLPFCVAEKNDDKKTSACALFGNIVQHCAPNEKHVVWKEGFDTLFTHLEHLVSSSGKESDSTVYAITSVLIAYFGSSRSSGDTDISKHNSRVLSLYFRMLSGINAGNTVKSVSVDVGIRERVLEAAPCVLISIEDNGTLVERLNDFMPFYLSALGDFQGNETELIHVVDAAVAGLGELISKCSQSSMLHHCKTILVAAIDVMKIAAVDGKGTAMEDDEKCSNAEVLAIVSACTDLCSDIALLMGQRFIPFVLVVMSALHGLKASCDDCGNLALAALLTYTAIFQVC
jgi:hypothetical protein